MSDLVDVFKYAVADENEEAVRAVIYRANDWCRTQLTKQHMAMDVFRIIDSYISHLGLFENATRREQWEDFHSRIVQSNATLLSLPLVP